MNWRQTVLVLLTPADVRLHDRLAHGCNGPRVRTRPNLPGSYSRSPIPGDPPHSTRPGPHREQPARHQGPRRHGPPAGHRHDSNIDGHRHFSEQDIAFLASDRQTPCGKRPQIKQVGFRLIQRGERGYGERAGAAVGSSEPPLRHSTEETTSGSVFVYGHSLFITLTEYRHRRDDPDMVNMPNRRLPQSGVGLNRQLTFAPVEALRSDQFAPTFIDDPANVLIIDYEALAKLPLLATPPTPSPRTTAMPQPSPTTESAAPAAPESELQTIKDEMKKRDSEVEELRKELRDIKRQLGQQPGKRSTTPSK